MSTDTMPEFKVEPKLNFREMRDFCSTFYGYASNKRDEYGKKRAENAKVAFRLYKAAQDKFYAEYHWFGDNIGDEDGLGEGDIMTHYRVFVDGLWDIHNAEDGLSPVGPERWSMMWGIEEALSTMFSDWKPRYK